MGYAVLEHNNQDLQGEGKMNWFKRLFGGEQRLAQLDPLNLILAHGITLPLVRVPTGEFTMGSTVAEDAYDNERPQHKVFLDEYLVGKYEVTVAQYRAFVKATGYKADYEVLRIGVDDHPVYNVSWNDAQVFCKWVSQVTDRDVHLPTEAQWEKAARGTDGRTYPWGNQSPDSNHCNIFSRVYGDTTPVWKYSPLGDSPYGCADMVGNVCEFVNDWYVANYYASSPSNNPTGPTSGETKVLRGSYHLTDFHCYRSAYRGSSIWGPDLRNLVVGFRCAVSAGS